MLAGLALRSVDRQTGDCHQMASPRVSALLALEVENRSPGKTKNQFGSIRRECLDHVIVLSEGHLRRILKRYFIYYHNSRPHQALDQNAPIPRTVESGKKGPVISIPEVGGLHHRYQRAA